MCALYKCGILQQADGSNTVADNEYDHEESHTMYLAFASVNVSKLLHMKLNTVYPLHVTTACMNPVLQVGGFLDQLATAHEAKVLPETFSCWQQCNRYCLQFVHMIAT